MSYGFQPHRAVYELAGGGSEVLVVRRDVDGWRIESRLEAAEAQAEITWTLRRDLSTRVLQVTSRDALAEEHELELAVTGNGLLAHRVGPDGPSQVELGWGPDAELDHLSAVFSSVIAARSSLEPGQTRSVRAVHVGTEDLELTVIDQEYRSVGENRLVCATPTTGHEAELVIGDLGALVSYEGLTRLVELTPL